MDSYENLEWPTDGDSFHNTEFWLFRERLEAL